MVNFVKFDASELEALADMGFHPQAVSEIILGPSDLKVPSIHPDCPDWARFFVAREYRACEHTYKALRQREMRAPDPRTGDFFSSTYTFIPASFPARTVPVFKVFNEGEAVFCLVFCSITNRVTHIIVPNRECVIYDLDLANASAVWDTFKAHSVPSLPVIQPRRRVGVVDMVASFAHQAMNHLSGIQRLVDSGLDHQIDEIWVWGTEFYGPTEGVFPELADKIFHVDPAEMPARLNQCGYDVFKLGSNMVTATLRERLLRLAAASPWKINSPVRSPLIGFTIRSEGRRCVNLPEVIEAIVTGLLPNHPKLGLVLDGWVFPETSVLACSALVTAFSTHYASRMRQEAELCQHISARLPAGIIVRNLVGMSTLESIHGLSDVDAYFAHVGTLQHKIGWFTAARGIIHGPQAALSALDSSAHSTEVGSPPVIMNKEDVADIVVDTSRGPGFYDYEIRDVSAVVSMLNEILVARKTPSET